MSYIDTQYLFKCETCRNRIGEDKCYTFCDSGESYSPNMSKIPTDDVVEVVRCKDCKHYKGEQSNCWLMRAKMQPTDYCSYGERSENGKS